MAQTKAHDLEAFCATCPTVQEVTIVLQALGLELTFHMDAVISPEYAQLPPLPAQYHYRDRHGSEVVFLAGHDADLDGVRLPAHASFLDISRRGCRSRLVDCPYDGYYVVTCLATCITTVPGCRIRRWRHQMQEVHIICTWDQLQPMEQALEEQFEAQKEKVTILDWGTSYKKEAGYIVVEWDDEVDAAFIDQLTADNDVEDFSVYTVPCITDGQLCILESAELEM